MLDKLFKSAEPKADETQFPVCFSSGEWKQKLSPEQYRIMREQGTEPPGSSPLNREKRTGTFFCAACGQALFESGTKYESGSGWPSFFRPIEGAVSTQVDRSHSMTRVEALCSRCGGHLGHVFEDGPAPTGLRYCMNGAALDFRPQEG